LLLKQGDKEGSEEEEAGEEGGGEEGGRAGVVCGVEGQRTVAGGMTRDTVVHHVEGDVVHACGGEEKEH